MLLLWDAALLAVRVDLLGSLSHFIKHLKYQERDLEQYYLELQVQKIVLSLYCWKDSLEAGTF